MSYDFPVSYGCGVCGKEVNSSEPIEDEYDGTWLCPKCAETYVSEDEILSRAISHYGEPAQVLKCIEELAELQVELLEAIDTDYPETHAERGQILEYLDFVRRWVKHRIEYNSFYMDVGNVAQITSELADVSLTTSQMLKIFNCSEEVEKIKQEKLSRLEARMRGDSQ